MIDTTKFLKSAEYLKLNDIKGVHKKYQHIFTYLKLNHTTHDLKEIEKASINALILHLRNK